jgi:hypothetical protein
MEGGTAFPGHVGNPTQDNSTQASNLQLIVTDSESSPLWVRSLRSMSGITALASSVRAAGVKMESDAVL